AGDRRVLERERGRPAADLYSRLSFSRDASRGVHAGSGRNALEDGSAGEGGGESRSLEVSHRSRGGGAALSPEAGAMGQDRPGRNAGAPAELRRTARPPDVAGARAAGGVVPGSRQFRRRRATSGIGPPAGSDRAG